MIEATYIDHMGSDLSVVNAARVSFGKKSEWDFECDCVTDWSCIMAGGCDCGEPKNARQLSKRDTKLIKYLAKHKHISPFGHAFASFHVRAPIFVARQLVKHSYLRWNEVSRRYIDDEPEFYEPDVWRGRSEDKKQGSDGVIDLRTEHVECGRYTDHLPYVIEGVMKDTLTLYNTLLYRGVAPEQARMVLPQSTMTEWYWSGSLDAFARMCSLRCKPDTQYESRLVADQISEKMASLFPVSWAALTGDDHG
jgi:thymidylate synthase (FAD)